MGSSLISSPDMCDWDLLVVAQHGWLTSHKFSLKTKKFVALEKNTEIKKSVFEIHMPPGLRKDLLKTLDRLRVNSHTLFPDFEGLCKYLNWRHDRA